MPQTTVYSFADTYAVFNHPAFPAYTLNGQGLGRMDVAYTNENTSHELAADGSVMVSKILADNGHLTITMQQTSTLHQWLKNLFNALYTLPTSLWASATVSISSPTNGFDNIELSGVSFAKRADQPFEQHGQMVTWSLMFAKGTTIGSGLSAINLNQSTLLNNI